MKRISAFVLLLFYLFGLTGCGKTSDDGGTSGAGSSEIPKIKETTQAENEIGLTLSAKDVTSSGLTLVFTQSGDSPTRELFTGADYSLERFEDDAWTAVETLSSEPTAWIAIAYSIEMDGTTEKEVDWSSLYGELETGHYRVVKTVDFRATGDWDYDTITLHAEFDVEG